MPSSIRIVMADDAAAVRRMVTDTLSKCPEIEVVGAARDGKEALAIIDREKPDVILLDVEMPVMDGIDALKQIRRTDRRTPVLMFSSLTVKGGEATLDALSCGANDYVAKPTGMKNAADAVNYLQSELVPKIHQWGKRTSPTARRKAAAVKPAAVVKPSAAVRSAAMPRAAAGPIDVVAIGSSTGGPNTLSDIVSKLPADLKTPILIVQHMPAVFTQLLAERLDRKCPLSVTEAKEGDVIRSGRILVAPGDYHMGIKKVGPEYRIDLHQAAPENSCRPAVDVLFRSVAQHYGRKSLGVVLTGMGRDGASGCEDMKKQGAAIYAQDEASCVVWGMPRAVAEAGLADRIVTLDDMHTAIIDAAGRKKQRAQMLAAT